MLALTVRACDYITIGDDVVIQMLKVAIDAPREMAIERAKVRKQNAETPKCIKRLREKYQN